MAGFNGAEVGAEGVADGGVGDVDEAVVYGEVEFGGVGGAVFEGFEDAFNGVNAFGWVAVLDEAADYLGAAGEDAVGGI